jgi:uncharacterized membrane protein YedE/YeeE
MIDILSRPWPWYLAGPAIGLFVPALLLLGNRLFGISSNFRHLCAAVAPGRRPEFFRYDWKGAGLWNLAFILGMVIGGYLGGYLFASPVDISEATRNDLARLGVPVGDRLYPDALFNWQTLFSLPGFLCLVAGGFLVGFGTSYAGGCTSGHAITGLASFQLPSLVAVIGFFAGGLAGAWIVLPMILGLR